MNVVFVPGGNLGDVGSGLFDDALAAEAGVELEAGGHVEAVELEIFGFGDAFGAFLEEHMAGGAGGYASAGVIHKDVVVLGDVEEAHGLAVTVVGHGAVGELDGFVFRLEGDADHVGGGRLGEVDFWEGVLVIRHNLSSLVLVGGLCRGGDVLGLGESRAIGQGLIDGAEVFGSRIGVYSGCALKTTSQAS